MILSRRTHGCLGQGHALFDDLAKREWFPLPSDIDHVVGSGSQPLIGDDFLHSSAYDTLVLHPFAPIPDHVFLCYVLDAFQSMVCGD